MVPPRLAALLLLLLYAAAWPASAVDLNVASSDELSRALAKLAGGKASSPHTIHLASGVYLLDTPLHLAAPSSSLSLAAAPGALQPPVLSCRAATSALTIAVGQADSIFIQVGGQPACLPHTSWTWDPTCMLHGTPPACCTGPHLHAARDPTCMLNGTSPACCTGPHLSHEPLTGPPWNFTAVLF